MLLFFSDKPGSFTAAKGVMTELGIPNVSDQDLINIRYICQSVSTRAGIMVSASMAVLLNKMGFENVTIGIDGSLYRFHPGFSDLMNQKIAELIKPGIKVCTNN